MPTKQRETNELVDILGLQHDASVNELTAGEKGLTWQEALALLPAWKRNTLKPLTEKRKDDSVARHL